MSSLAYYAHSIKSKRFPLSYVSQLLDTLQQGIECSLFLSHDEVGNRLGYRTISIGEKPYLDPAVGLSFS
jgi:hypothetical protein